MLSGQSEKTGKILTHLVTVNVDNKPSFASFTFEQFRVRGDVVD